jgi:hypothetical protein
VAEAIERIGQMPDGDGASDAARLTQIALAQIDAGLS